MKNKKIENIVQVEENKTDDESSIELKQPKIIDDKPKKERKPYVMTDARKEAFEKSQIKKR